MAIVICPHCGEKGRFASKYLGRDGQCARCQAVFRLTETTIVSDGSSELEIATSDIDSAKVDGFLPAPEPQTAQQYYLDDASQSDSLASTDEKAKRQLSETLTQPRRAIWEWGIYAGILFTLVAVFCGVLVLDALKADKSGLCFLILCLFVAAVIRNALDVIYLDNQLRLAYMQVSQLIKTRKIGPFLREIEPSLLREHLVNLHEIAKRDPFVSQDNLVALLQTRLSARLRISQVAATLLVTLGLIGTIVGLISAITGVETVVDAVGDDKSQLLTGVGSTLGGMGTAFYTTLMGALLGSVVLRILTTLAGSHADHLVAHIAELSEVYMLPALRSASRNRMRLAGQSESNGTGL